MIIAIDLRSIQKGNFSGVENYTLSCLEHMIQADKSNRYLLFYNGLKIQQRPELNFLNTQTLIKKVPNKLLALSIKLLKKPDFNFFAGEFDSFFMPNINHIKLNPTKKLIVTVHDLSPLHLPESFDLKRRIWHWSVDFKKTLHRANKVIAVSESTKKDLVNTLNISADKIKVIYQGVDHERFSPSLNHDRLRAVRNFYGLPGEFILFLATIEPRKNLLRLLKAWENLEMDIPLVIAGKPGWKYHELFRVAAKSKKRSRLQFLGFVPEEDKPYIMKLATLFAFPSLYEGFGLPVLESMAVGTPVLTSSVTSLPEVAGDAGILVNPYNTDEITYGLSEALKSEYLRDQMSKRGLELAGNFTWANTAQQTLDFLTNKS